MPQEPRSDIILAREAVEAQRQLTDTVQAARENMYGALGDLASEVKKHREQLALAAAAAERGSRQMTTLTKVLIGSQIAYVLLTAGILYATWQQS